MLQKTFFSGRKIWVPYLSLKEKRSGEMKFRPWSLIFVTRDRIICQLIQLLKSKLIFDSNSIRIRFENNSNYIRKDTYKIKKLNLKYLPHLRSRVHFYTHAHYLSDKKKQIFVKIQLNFLFHYFRFRIHCSNLLRYSLDLEQILSQEFQDDHDDGVLLSIFHELVYCNHSLESFWTIILIQNLRVFEFGLWHFVDLDHLFF